MDLDIGVGPVERFGCGHVAPGDQRLGREFPGELLESLRLAVIEHHVDEAVVGQQFGDLRLVVGHQFGIVERIDLGSCTADRRALLVQQPEIVG